MAASLQQENRMPIDRTGATRAVPSSFEIAPDRVKNAIAELLGKLGAKANKLDISWEHREERIMIRFSSSAERQTEVLLAKAGVEKRNTGIRDVWSYKGVEVALSPYGAATFG
jgi:hypothetical protein